MLLGRFINIPCCPFCHSRPRHQCICLNTGTICWVFGIWLQTSLQQKGKFTSLKPFPFNFNCSRHQNNRLSGDAFIKDKPRILVPALLDGCIFLVGVTEFRWSNPWSRWCGGPVWLHVPDGSLHKRLPERCRSFITITDWMEFTPQSLDRKIKKDMLEKVLSFLQFLSGMW